MIRAALVALAVILASLAGCAASPERTGPHYLGPDVFSRIGADSDMDDVEDALGPPYSRTELGQGRELWSYRWHLEYEDGRVRHRSIRRGEPTPTSGTLYLIFLTNGKLGRYYVN